jgi:hypothetical protein
MGIVLKSERELAKMRRAGVIVRAVLDAVEAACVPGVTTAELNASPPVRFAAVDRIIIIGQSDVAHTAGSEAGFVG